MRRRVVAVEPEHIDSVIVPDTHHENHSPGERSTHVRETAHRGLSIGPAERRRFSSAEGVTDGILGGGDARNVGCGVLDHLAILHIEAADFDEFTGGSAVRCDELGDDGEFGGGVNSLFGAKEGCVAKAVGVEVAAGFVAGAGGGAGLAGGSANVRSVGGVEGVGFPDVHFIAAGAVVAISGVGRGAVPVEAVGLRIVQ